VFKFEGMSQDEAQLVLNALAEVPLKLSFNLFVKLNGQLQEQLAPPAPAEKPADPKKKA
jgi:hypothetical protein